MGITCQLVDEKGKIFSYFNTMENLEKDLNGLKDYMYFLKPVKGHSIDIEKIKD